MITSSIDVSGMESVLRQISTMTRRPMREVTTAEALSILQTCLDRTEITPASKIKDKLKTKFNQYSATGKFGTRSDGSFPKITSCSRNGNVWLGLPRPSSGAFSKTRGRRGGGVWYLASKNYLRDQDWNTFQELTRDQLKDLKKLTTEWIARRGLPKATWYFAGEALGAALKASAVVIKSTLRGRAPKELGTAVKKETSEGFTITVRNSSIASMRKDAEGILQRAVAGRAKYFQKNLEKGVFDSMKNVERAYPNLVKVRAA